MKTSPRKTVRIKAAQAVKTPKMRLPRGRDRCAGCHSERRDQLDADLVAKIPYRVLSQRYGISTTAIFRHKKHVSVSLVRVEASTTPIIIGNGSLLSSDDVLVEARHLYEICRGALDAATAEGNMLQLALAAREVRGALDLLGRQLERLEQRRSAAVVDYATLPAAVAMRTKMLQALAAFPEARRAVAAVLDLDEDES